MAKQSPSSKFNSRYLWAILPLLIVGWILYQFSDIVTYVLVGWVISMIGAPVVVFLRKYLGKNLAAGITLAGFVLIFVLLAAIFIPPISKQARQLAGIDYSQLIENLEEPIGQWEQWATDKGFIIAVEEEEQSDPMDKMDYVHTQVVDIDSLLSKKYIADSTARNENITLLIKIDGSQLNEQSSELEVERLTFFEQAKGNLYEFLNPSVIPKLFKSVVGTLGNFLIGLLSVLFISFFFLKEQGLFNTMLAGVVPDKHEDTL